MIRKLALGAALFAVICGIWYFRAHRTQTTKETVYAANRQVVVWDSTAQIRSQVTTVNFGAPLQVIQRFESQIHVRTPAGITGWVSDDDTLTAEFWKKTQDLETEAATLPPQAQGHTRVLSNLRVAPGRDAARIRQLAKDIPVDLLRRDVAVVPDTQANATATPAPSPPQPADTNASAPNDSSTDSSAAYPAVPTGPKKEDWWFVRARLRDQTTASGWVLGRFIELDVPQPLPDYANASGLRIVAWYELNRVNDSSGQPKSQYLLVGTRGPEGQACDFLMLRVYTWGTQRGEYETAFVDSDVCGKFPVQVMSQGKPNDVAFAFDDTSSGIRERRVYHMVNTIVRRVRENGNSPRAKKH